MKIHNNAFGLAVNSKVKVGFSASKLSGTTAKIMAVQDSVSIIFAGKGDAETPDAKLNALLEGKALVTREAVDALIQAGADMNRTRDWFPLSSAAWNGHVEAVKYFIEKKADLNDGGDKLRTPLHIAIYRRHSEIAKLLVEAGADFSKMWRYGSTPLGEAAKVGDKKTFDLLLSKGADPKALGHEGRSMLYDAVEGGSLSILKRLLAFGLDPNRIDTSVIPVPVLMRAVEKGRADMVEALLDAGADAKATFFEGHNMFHVLGRDLYKKLKASSKNPNILNHKKLGSPKRKANLDKIVQLLVAAGVDINSRTHNQLGWTPLEGSPDPYVNEVLMKYGAKARIQKEDKVSKFVDQVWVLLEHWLSR